MRTFLLAATAAMTSLPCAGYAQSLYRSTNGPDTGVVFEVQRNTAAGVVVALGSQTTHVYSGRVDTRVTGGESPLTTVITVAGDVQVSTLDGAPVRQQHVALHTRVGTTTLELDDGATPQILIPYGYDMATTLHDWRGYHAFLRRVSEHELDVTAFEFDAETTIDGQAALLGTSPTGRAALLFRNPQTGAVAGAYEAKVQTVIAFALLGTVQTSQEAEAVWVDTGSSGELVGPDRNLRLVRLDKPAFKAKGHVMFDPAWLPLAAAGRLALDQARPNDLETPARAQAAVHAPTLPESE